MSKSLVIQGKAVTVTELESPRHFMAQKFGVTLPASVKGAKGPSMKDVKALCVAKGATADQIKAANKEYDAKRSAFYLNSALVNGQLAADPSVRKSLRASVNKAGEVIGAVCTYRRERSASQSQANIIAQLRAELAATKALLAPASA